MTEKDWPDNIPKSEGTLEINMDLGEIILTDGPRVIICAECGVPQTDGKVFHIKPALYAIEYRGLMFYLERHLCITCAAQLQPSELNE